LLEQLVVALRAGQLCVLPTETVYGLAVQPDNAAAIARARVLKGRDEQHEFTWHLSCAADASDLARVDDVRVQRLFERYWPGPLTLVLPTVTDQAKTIGLRVPAHDFTRAVIAASGKALLLTSVNKTGAAPLCDAALIERQLEGQIDLLVDDGVSPVGMASTVARCIGPELEILRQGILSSGDVLSAAAANILFVCTGNTCRSPLAEAFARQRMADRLAVASDAVLARGLNFCSSGTATLPGVPASEGSLTGAAELGIDLSAHRSSALTPQLLDQADRIYCLSHSHRLAVLELAPEAADKTMLLHHSGDDISDPFGHDLQTYRAARDEIIRAIDARLGEWSTLLPAQQ